ncbi:hypothetical protein AUC69_00455 [Methyloceanibacter superfactus]|uniref:Mitochondrial inner membrane protein n=1 Tax=Methyloceanibacter superfactus TaxID=1774969 RepID=A0A1E3W919_9HYPH|nr:mitofilin family membrane protein [Methyloceanibacter superfactus]ODS02002.1 hypothetical protein AUC69_00455 [Methyloceanibacter superfactus]
MVGAFGKKDNGQDQAGTRPVPTIEGTATEVTVEPETAEDVTAKAAATKDDESKTNESNEDVSGTEAETEETAALEPPETEPDETECHETAAPPKARGSGGGRILGNLTAGLLGGLAGAGALALAWVYLPQSMNKQAEAPDLSPLESRIAKLEGAPAPDTGAALAEEMSKLEAKIAALEGQEAKLPPEVSGLSDRVAQIETSFKAMAEAAKDGGSVGDAAAISQQIGAAEQRLDGKLESALAEAKSANAASLEALRKEIAGLDAKLRALANAELSAGEAARLVPEIAVIDERLSKLEAGLPALLDAVGEESEDTKAATQAIAFANLRAAVSEGRPYATELATLAALSPGAGDLGRLLDYEDTGIPTLPELIRSFKKTRAELTPAPAAEGSIIDRFVASAESLVKVKRIDAEAEGDGPDAVLSRAEAQLEQGDLAASVAEVDKLQGAPRAAFATWLDQARARLGADDTLQRLENILLVSLGGGGARGADQTNEQN